MALIKCPNCGKEINDKLINCPYCGYKISLKNLKQKPQSNSVVSAIVIAIIVLVVLIPLKACFDSSIEQKKQDDLQEFDKQMHKDPSTWTDEEKDEFNDFWEYANEDSKNDDD